VAYGDPSGHLPVTACRIHSSRPPWRALVVLGLATAMAVVLLGLLGAVGRQVAVSSADHGGETVLVPVETSPGAGTVLQDRVPSGG
jgi:hypothetical protein